MGEKEALRRIIKTYGDVKTCGNCVQLEGTIKDKVIQGSKIPVEFNQVDINSPEGREYVDKNDVKDMPYTKDCTIYKRQPKEVEECRTIVGYNEQDWVQNEQAK
jgi:hypothetical protein